VSAEDNLSITYSIIAVIIASISVGIAFFGFILSLKKSKIEKLTHEYQFITQNIRDLAIVEERLSNLKTFQDCHRYATDYLNALLPLSLFEERGVLSKDVIEYFDNYLKWGFGYVNWLHDAGFIEGEPENDKFFGGVITICKKYDIDPPDTPPKIFQKVLEDKKEKK